MNFGGFRGSCFLKVRHAKRLGSRQTASVGPRTFSPPRHPGFCPCRLEGGSPALHSGGMAACSRSARRAAPPPPDGIATTDSTPEGVAAGLAPLAGRECFGPGDPVARRFAPHAPATRRHASGMRRPRPPSPPIGNGGQRPARGQTGRLFGHKKDLSLHRRPAGQVDGRTTRPI